MTNQNSSEINQFDPRLATKVWGISTAIAVLFGIGTYLFASSHQWSNGSALVAGIFVFGIVFVVEVICIVLFSLIKSISEPDEP